MDLATVLLVFVLGVWVGSRNREPRGGGYVGPRDSKPMQPEQFINPRPRDRT